MTCWPDAVSVGQVVMPAMCCAETFQCAVHVFTGDLPLETLSQLLDFADGRVPKLILLQPTRQCFQAVGELRCRAVVREQVFLFL